MFGGSPGFDLEFEVIGEVESAIEVGRAEGGGGGTIFDTTIIGGGGGGGGGIFFTVERITAGSLQWLGNEIFDGFSNAAFKDWTLPAGGIDCKSMLAGVLLLEGIVIGLRVGSGGGGGKGTLGLVIDPDVGSDTGGGGGGGTFFCNNCCFCLVNAGFTGRTGGGSAWANLGEALCKRAIHSLASSSSSHRNRCVTTTNVFP